MDVESARSYGPYRTDDGIFRDALGRSVRTEDTRTGTEVALKVLKPVLANDAVYISRLEDQLRQASRISHPRVAQPLEWGFRSDAYVIASPFVAGPQLGSLLREGALETAVATSVLGDVASGLAAVHSERLAHQAMSTEKIVVDDDGRATLIEAGLVSYGAYSRLTTRLDQVLGNVRYIAPEVVRGEPPTAPSDVYGLGCVAFECLTGHPPFDDIAAYEIPLAHLEREPPDLAEVAPQLPRHVARVVSLALAKSPSDRPSAREFEGALTAGNAELSQTRPTRLQASFVLRVTDAEGVHREFEIRSRAVIGRQDVDIVIPEDEVSRKHAALVASDAGLELRDLGSLNGTAVNGRPVTSPVVVSIGDMIQIGASVLEVRAAPGRRP